MKRLSIAFLAAGLVALAACGGASDETAVDNTATDTLAVPEDDTLAPVDEALGNATEANAIDAGNSAEANVADASAETNGQ